MGRIQRTRMLLAVVVVMLHANCDAPPDGGQGNGTANGNQNSAGTGNTVNDLPDLSTDDALGEGEGGDAAVPGLILIGFDQTLREDSFLQRADAAASTLNGILVDVLADIRLCSVAVDPAAEAEALALAASLSRVDFAESNAAGQLAEVSDLLPAANSVQFAQYHLFVTDAIRARAFDLPAENQVTMAVLDSGCDLGHPEFDGAPVFAGANYVADATDISDIADDVVEGHGTAVVSLLAAVQNQGQIAGLLRGANTTVYKVADQTGSVTLAAAVKGLVGALNGDNDGDFDTSEIPGANVVNVSFSFAGDYDSLARAVFHAADRGVVVVAAAGNNGRSAQATSARYPAGYSTVLAVGASDIADRALPFTNRAAVLEVVAPGADLLVAAPRGTYRFADGTSLAAAQVAGAAALLLQQQPALDISAVRQRLNLRGDELPAGSGFGAVAVRRLNVHATLVDENGPPEPYIIPDQDVVQATGVASETLAAGMVGVSQNASTPEAFSGETVYWYGYFPGGQVSFALLDDGSREEVTLSSLSSATIELFLEFVRGIALGTTTATFGVLQQATVTLPDLGGERRVVDMVASANGVDSEPRSLLYNPLQRGYNVIAYKNFDSSVWHFREEEGLAFMPNLADLQLLGGGPQPEINWDGEVAVDRLLLGSNLDPAYLVTSQNPQGDDLPLIPPVKIGACVGAEVLQQVCGPSIGLPEREIARIVVRGPISGTSRFATLDVIYVP